MKKSGYRTIFHIYLIFFLSLIGTIIVTIGIFYLMITVQVPDGSTVKSDWPKTVTEDFGEQIIFTSDNPQIKQAGIELLQENGIGMQILDDSGCEIFSYQKPKQSDDTYSDTELLHLYQTGQLESSETTSFIGTVTNNGNDYTYILHFPVKVSKITMYLNAERFTGGKTIVLLIVGILFAVVLVSGIIYGFWTTRIMSQLTASVKEIATRSYLPIQIHGAFGDVYSSLNTLDTEIKASDRLREQTEKMRKEWIANITHDLKTPLSPIKGYAEMLQAHSTKTEEQYKRYAQVMLKNVAYMETLIDDLKLTYQLENGMIPLKRQEQNFIRFIKELIIDILNNPEYEHRTIHFEATEETVLISFDQTLLTRAFQNLIINAFVHGNENTEVTLQTSVSDTILQVIVSDNGKGMTAEEAGSLFQRYYRGTGAEHKLQGTGLGLAISKSIVELHGGTVSVSSIPSIGTAFQIQFPIN
ncbi:HAMP domain-containing sensor histidine kinase [Sinanaerobacter sp. ZZT-01]|uniref:sensor histidine kinase n=1 Tax=Sinanaerobacter sp. ZZT-01 TaxID=3111540 RepID=UPI002D77A068|nr:HAMP domain-containing sensor histidine kinase [Sinanaerobacter sp. ZZT-01]WRR93403.1 HAMP domain-containing sensor histidine kinase [Sinanaerobacter sp. ZZT-01]